MRINEIITAEFYTNNGSEYPLNKSSREFHGLVYLTCKRGKLIIDGKSYNNSTGNISYLPYRSQYRVELPDNYLSCYVINFSGEVKYGHIIQDNCTDLAPLFEQATRLWRRHREDEYFRLDCMAITYRIFAELLRRRDNSAPPCRIKKQINPCIEKIHESYILPDFKVSTLAPMIGVSERYLCRRFNEVYGMSPKRYLNELRIKRAKELLIGNFNVSEVAGLTGFRDIYHFSSFFKTQCGISPSEYRVSKNFVI